MTEALIAVAVTIVLLAVSFIGVSQIRSRLKITELDNAAREIYLAAQNRAVLLSNRGALTQLVAPAGISSANALEQPDGTVYYYIDNKTTDTTTFDQLLPKGTIDPVLTDGHFYIVFEPNSASVTDVFYIEDDTKDLPGGIETYYFDVNTRLRETRRTSDPMVGWYGGDPSEAGNAIVLRSPELIIHNEDVLWVEVRWWVPTMLADLNNAIELSLQLEYDSTTVDLTTSGRQLGTDTPKISSSNFVHSTAYVLDSLASGVGSKQQFKDLFTALGLAPNTLGGDFTVTATVSLRSGTRVPGGLQVSPGTYKASDNSLFAKETGNGNTAYIRYMRHLQNLEPSFSDVRDGITAAVQTTDIDDPSVPHKYEKSADETANDGSKYEFTPIDNENLTSYDGQENEIRGLLVKERGDAGLFGAFGKTTGGDPAKLTDVRLVNAQVSNTNPGTGAAGTDIYAGALAAQISNADVTGCQVYWIKTDATQADLTTVLGHADRDSYAIGSDPGYMVTGPIAGGLFGHAAGVTIDHSSASTTAKGATYTGGLVGQGERLNVDCSYADCYLTGPHAAGLVGDLTGLDNSLDHVYSAGFINIDDSTGAVDHYASGLFNGGMSVGVSNSYAAMAYGGAVDPAGNNVTPIGNGALMNDNNVYYLSSDVNSTQNGADPVDGSELKAMAAEGGLDGFVNQLASLSFSYNLQDEMALGRYPFPGIDGLAHYGDWPDALRVESLVYWETYKNKESGDAINDANGAVYGVYGGNIDILQNNDAYVVSDDGYAIVLSDNLFSSDRDAVVTINYRATLPNTGVTVTASQQYSLNGGSGGTTSLIPFIYNGEQFYLAKLPQALIEPDLADPDSLPLNSFYWRLEAAISLDSQPSTGRNIFYYDPHFAATAQDAVGVAAPDAPQSISVRSARHFYNLSRYQFYYNSTNVYTFLQRLDIDYNLYTGSFGPGDTDTYTNLANMGGQSPIGKNASAPFSKVYNGAYHSVQNVPLQADKLAEYVGLFGYNIGSINNLFYLGGSYDHNRVDPAETPECPLELSISAHGSDASTATTRYVGQFCGYNSGSIYNCAVSHVKLNLIAMEYATLYAGGMVGGNSRLISNCAAVTDELEMNSTNSDAWLGGFAGSNAGGAVIENCYAVGRLEANKSLGSSRGLLHLAGFAADNPGRINYSYCATSLILANGLLKSGFCPDGANTTNCFFLDQGYFDLKHPDTDDTFTFSAQYATSADAALSKPWSFFTNTSTTDTANSLLANLGDSFSLLTGSNDKYNDNYVFPKIVQVSADDADKRHFDVFVEKVDMGSFGVYYWEHETNGNQGYHMSAVIIDVKNGVIQEDVRYLNNLCVSHTDNGVIDDYGYGWFCTSSLTTGLTAATDGIAIAGSTATGGPTAPSPDTSWITQVGDTTVNDALAGLLGSNLELHSFHTAGNDGTNGLYLVNRLLNSAVGYSRALNGTVTLTYSGQKKVFELNPFFADSIELHEEHVPGTLGQKVDFPYKIRSVKQLQFINWNAYWRNCDKYIYIGINKYLPTDAYLNASGQFPYLRWVKANATDPSKAAAVGDGEYFWKQSHDLDGALSGGGYTDFFPISSLVNICGDNDKAKLYGCFSGSYNGDNYTIKNLDISSRVGNTVGLFGVTVDAMLSNITLYSEKGDNVIRMDNSQRNGTDNPVHLYGTTEGSYNDNYLSDSGSERSWYAAGALVGLAIQSNGAADGERISNCAVAGYDIIDECPYVGYGGGAVGGLVGICNVDLTCCTAVTDIRIGFTHSSSGRNIRVGGLAGSCQSSISSCYSGGSITVGSTKIDPDTSAPYDTYNKSNTNLYIGRIFGGIFMRTMYTAANTTTGVTDITAVAKNPTISNSYSYVTLPDLPQNNDKTRVFYNIAGKADGTNSVTFSNCYFLEQRNIKTTITTDSTETGEVTSLTYQQMSNMDPEASDGLLKTLNDQIAEASEKFSPVTAVDATGTSLNGRYSYPSRDSLSGLNYPFPTILTMSGQSGVLGSDDAAHVHYGNWPQNDLVRKDNAPVVVDLFANYHPADPAAGAAPGTLGQSYQDVQVWVSDLLEGRMGTGTTGKFTCESADTNVCDAVALDSADWDSVKDRDEEIEKKGDLNTYVRITAVGQGTTTVTVKFTYPDASGNPQTAEMEITVNVTADMVLAPLGAATAGAANTVSLFAGHENDMLDLYAYDTQGDPIDPALMENIQINADSFHSEEQYIIAAEQQTDPYSYTDTAGVHTAAMTLKLHSGEATPADQTTNLTVEYSFSFGGTPFTGTAIIACQVHSLSVTAKDLLFTLGTPDSLIFEPGAMLTFALDKDPTDPASTGTPFTPEDLASARFNITQAMGSTGQTVDITTAQAAGYGSAVITPRAPGEEMITIDFTFQYGLCRHAARVYPMAYVYAAGGAALTLTSIGMQPDSTLIALSESTGAWATINISNHVGADWKLEWYVDPDADEFLSVTPDADPTTATVSVIKAPGDDRIMKVFVTATVPPLKAGDAERTLTGTAEVQIKNPSVPGGDPGVSEGPGLEDPAPSDTPVPEGDPGMEGPGLDGPGIEEPTGSPEPSESPVPVEPSDSPAPGDGPSESPPFDPEASPVDSPEPVEPSDSPEPGDGPSESPPFEPEASPADSPAPVEPSDSPAPGGGPSESPPFEPGASSPADSPAPAEPSNTTAPDASPEAVG